MSEVINSEPVKFVVGGAVQVYEGTYLERPADEELLGACKKGEFAYVLACRQIGKSSLMNETEKKLCQAGIKTAVIDLTGLGKPENAEGWYFSLLDELARRLQLKTNVDTWWKKKPSLLAPTQRFLQFLREVILKDITGSIVIFVDEIDFTLGLSFTEGFFAAIRAVYQDRVHNRDYDRLTFVLLGVATPDELVADSRHTPFNIGRSITLRDFTKEECTPFRRALEEVHPNQGGHYFDQIYEWTGGHPYLTQKLCREVQTSAQTDEPNLVDQLVRKTFLAAEARSEDNIQLIQRSVTTDPYAQPMLRVYRRILEEKEPIFDDEQFPAINRLKLYGLVVVRKGRLTVKNKLYTQAFNLTWTDEMLERTSLGIPDKYTVLQRLDQRGPVTIYLAQIQGSDGMQLIALKVLNFPKDMGSELALWVERLQRNAQAVAQANHPNTVRIFETGWINGKNLYIAMEYIPGGNLRNRLKDGPLSRHEAVEVVRQIGAALTYFHAQKVFHLAVNPNDILLDKRQEPLRIVLTDFGFARFSPEEPQDQLHRQYIMLTPQYVAPEQEQGDGLSPATDIYGLAVTFFESLTGQLPPDRKPGDPLPPLSSITPETGPYFDEILCRATAREPSNRFDTIANFVQAIEAANEKAEHVEQTERKMRAAAVIEAVQSYIQKGRYDPQKALSMIEAALEICPEYFEALVLRGRIWLQQGQFEKALEDYHQAYRRNQDISSEIGLEYLRLLTQIAENLWQREEFQEAVKHYETIRQILSGHEEETEAIQEIWQRARSCLVEYHYQEGDNAYALGCPEDIDGAITILEQKIQALEGLKTDNESQNLRLKLKELQVKKYEEAIKTAQKAIDEINTMESQVRFSNKIIFQHYAAIDEAYQALIKLEPEHQQWAEDRAKKLIECVQSRCVFAKWSLGKPEPNYESALRHYKAVYDLDHKHPGIIRELNLDLEAEIAEIERKANYDGKYNEIQKLIESKDYPEALRRLNQEFIRTGNYEHREAARWLWGLVYVKQHQGNFPPEWDSLAVLEALRKHLVHLEHARIQQLREQLEPWSQANIFQTMERESKLLGDYEDQLRDMEIILNDTAACCKAELPDLEARRRELREVREQVQKQRGLFAQQDMRSTTQKFDTWLQEIEKLETLLQAGQPVKDIPQLLTRTDDEQQSIREDVTFQTVQGLISARSEISQKIGEIKLSVRGRLVRVLINEINRKDEELTGVQAETSRLQTELTETQHQAATAQTDLVRAQEEIAGLQQQASWLKQQLEQPHKYHEINKYLIPAVVVLALLSGGFIATQVRVLAELPVLRWVALVLLIVYLIYYAWVYYLAKR